MKNIARNLNMDLFGPLVQNVFTKDCGYVKMLKNHTKDTKDLRKGDYRKMKCSIE